jgi:drug/metabolite transporter (DMT)-like permease
LLVGTYLYLLRPLQTRHRTLTVVTYTYSGALLTLIPLTIAAHQPLPTSTLSWTGILLIAGFTHLLGHTALSASLRFFSATLIAFICLLEPVIAAVGAAVFLHQALRPQIIVGGLTLLAAIAGILRDEDAAPEALIPNGGEF